MKVTSDEQAIALMNDSAFGLTAAIWTRDDDAALAIGDRVQTGTWFMNRCDYLDPALAWVGVKDSGRGCTLSVVGLRAPDAAEVVSPAGQDLRMSTLRGNWNYPTSIRFGAGRIAELPDACRALGMQRPLLVTDPALAACR